MKLVIGNTEIGQDEHGRYSLNDLHKASGGNKKHQPALFYRSDSFNNVVEVLNLQNRRFEPIVKKQGRYGGGTWVCKELVYKYAMWVDAEFEVRVIQTFDKMIDLNKSPSAMEALNELTRKIESDKEIASKCGQALAAYKKIRKENQDKFDSAVNEAQLTLGFK